MGPYEIYNATFEWKDCADMRPWLIVGPEIGGNYDCFPVSSKDYYGLKYELRTDHPLFSETGLNLGCFVYYASNIQVPKGAFGKRRGALVGELLADFKDVAGL